MVHNNNARTPYGGLTCNEGLRVVVQDDAGAKEKKEVSGVEADN